ncbi:MAG: mannose-1-phosphate guanylyltransferase/mannose-6-phosphate isomerase, partial [Beijerinckiaceae bacterium]
MTKIVPVLMCGGSGTRLWPLSRESLPKQFIPLLGEQSTFQSITSVLAQADRTGDIIVLTNREYRFLVAEQLEQIGVDAQIVLEPVRRDSGPAVAVAAELAAQAHGADAVVAIFAADHAIAKPQALLATIAKAADTAATGAIVTLGIEPDHPATGYGYIERGEAISGIADAFRVAKFVEKPDAETAKAYVEAAYLWNSGNFFFPAGLMCDEIRTFEPDIAAAAANAVAAAENDLQFLVLDEASFAAAPQKSIDYAVMERTRHAAVVPANVGWSDVGAWSSVRDLTSQDSAGNAIVGDGFTLDCEGVLVHSPGILTATVGLKDVIVVTTPDSVLAVDASRAAQVKDLVALLKQKNRLEASEHRRTLRPWGYYQSVDEGARYQVKRIVVKPGGCLSLQKHHHRAEHWIVVRGTAEVTVDGNIRLVHENESIYVPIGSVHRLANPGRIA